MSWSDDNSLKKKKCKKNLAKLCISHSQIIKKKKCLIIFFLRNKYTHIQRRWIGYYAKSHHKFYSKAIVSAHEPNGSISKKPIPCKRSPWLELKTYFSRISCTVSPPNRHWGKKLKRPMWPPKHNLAMGPLPLQSFEWAACNCTKELAILV